MTRCIPTALSIGKIFHLHCLSRPTLAVATMQLLFNFCLHMHTMTVEKYEIPHMAIGVSCRRALVQIWRVIFPLVIRWLDLRWTISADCCWTCPNLWFGKIHHWHFQHKCQPFGLNGRVACTQPWWTPEIWALLKAHGIFRCILCCSWNSKMPTWIVLPSLW